MNNILLRNRFYISLLIWLGNVLFWTVIISHVINEHFIPNWFWIACITAYLIQAGPYWWFLDRYFTNTRNGNIFLVISTSIAARCHLTVGKGFRRFYILPLMLFLFGLSSGLTCPTMALATNPGDNYVFPAESPVAPDGTSQQGGPTLSGNIALWSEFDSSLLKSRLFFKDLSKGSGEPGHALISDEYSGSTPEINQAGNRVVWSEMIGALLQVYSKDVDFSGSFSGCTGTVYDCSTALLPGNYWQENPSISPDGSKVAWENGRGHGSQIQIYDFNTGIVQELHGMPGGDQEYPSVDNEWIVWEDNRNFDSFVFPLNQHIYAKRIGSLDAPVSIADNGESANASVGSAKIGRNPNNELVVVYVKTATGNSPSSTIRLHNLADGSDVPLAQSSGRLDSPSINGDKVVWLDCSENWRCDVILHNLSTDVSQNVSQDTSLGALKPIVSNSSGYIVWGTTQLNPTTIYYNRMGDTAQMLANRFSPELYLHREEHFQPRKVDIMVAGEGTQLMASTGSNWANLLLEWPNLTLDSLGQYNTENDRTSSTYGKFLDLPGNLALAKAHTDTFRTDYVDRYESLINTNNYPETTYAHILKNPANGETTIQYWMPYYFDNWDNYHEGDWEHVDVVLNGNLDPIYAGYSQHDTGQRRPWDFVAGPDSHPIVYVARGSHANYFYPGPHDAPYWFTDETEAHDLHQPSVSVLPDVSSTYLASLAGSPFYWLAYQGAWGELTSLPGGDGPQGPAATPEHNSTWDDPFSWFNGLCWDGSDSCEEEPRSVRGTIYSPVDIHLYDSQGRHVGKNDQGGIDEQIPGAEYIEIPDLHAKSITVHEGDGTEGYRFVLKGTGTGTFDFTLVSPDRAHNSADTAKYLTVPVTTSTEASVILDQNKNYSLKIDTNGDGTEDEQRQPDSVVAQAVDLTPPAQTTDLSVTNASSGTAALAFTAPGDDAGAGTAQYYDLRYSTSPITEDNWKEAMPLADMPTPQVAGTRVTATATGLNAGTAYYFAFESRDDTLQSSGLSNIAAGTTTIPNLTWSRQRVYWASLNDYQNRKLSIDYRLSNTGTCPALAATIQASLCNHGTVYIVTQLPSEVGDINPGSNRTVTLKYFVPTNVGSFITSTYSTCSDDAGRTYWFPGAMP